MVSSDTQMSLLRWHGSQSTGKLFLLSQGWLKQFLFVQSRLTHSSSSSGFRVTFDWLNLHTACLMRITSRLDAQWLLYFNPYLWFKFFLLTIFFLSEEWHKFISIDFLFQILPMRDLSTYTNNFVCYCCRGCCHCSHPPDPHLLPIPRKPDRVSPIDNRTSTEK